MSKRGKYQKRPFWAARAAKPAKSSEKKTEVRNVLLQTYFTSLLCLVLCVTMFFGTSYAWFTSEVTNSGNEIYIGTLDVGLFKEIKDGKENLAGNSHQLFSKDIRWEPGYTALETIQVVNEGDLAFDYELLFTDGKGAAPAGKTLKLEDVAKFFDVWVYDHYNKNEPKPASYADITKENGWENAGSLKDLLAGKPVLEGVMSTVRKTAQTTAQGENQTTEPTAGPTDSLNTTDRYTIALHMREDADASVMGYQIGLNVKLVAYQRVQEQDGFGNGNYDEFTAVTNVEEFIEAMTSAQGGNVVMVEDIEIPEETPRIDIVGKVNLNMNGRKLTMHRAGTSIKIESTGSLTITGNGTMEKTLHGENILYADGELIIMDGTFRYTPYTWGANGDCAGAACNDHATNIQELGCIINGRLSSTNAAEKGSVIIYGGLFDSGIKNIDPNNAARYIFPILNCAEGTNRLSGAITVYGGQFVGVSPEVGDLNGPSFFLKGQTEKDVVPAGYTIESSVAADGRTVYTVTYTEPGA